MASDKTEVVAVYFPSWHPDNHYGARYRPGWTVLYKPGLLQLICDPWTSHASMPRGSRLRGEPPVKNPTQQKASDAGSR